MDVKEQFIADLKDAIRVSFNCKEDDLDAYITIAMLKNMAVNPYIKKNNYNFHNANIAYLSKGENIAVLAKNFLDDSDSSTVTIYDIANNSVKDIVIPEATLSVYSSDNVVVIIGNKTVYFYSAYGYCFYKVNKTAYKYTIPVVYSSKFFVIFEYNTFCYLVDYLGNTVHEFPKSIMACMMHCTFHYSIIDDSIMPVIIETITRKEKNSFSAKSYVLWLTEGKFMRQEISRKKQHINQCLPITYVKTEEHTYIAYPGDGMSYTFKVLGNNNIEICANSLIDFTISKKMDLEYLSIYKRDENTLISFTAIDNTLHVFSSNVNNIDAPDLMFMRNIAPFSFLCAQHCGTIYFMSERDILSKLSPEDTKDYTSYHFAGFVFHDPIALEVNSLLGKPLHIITSNNGIVSYAQVALAGDKILKESMEN